jgi:protein-S-isoprenylcysteine O-methyltransferase Ste14
MELIPALQIGYFNGWILLALEFFIQGLLLLIFPREVVRRLFYRSGWDDKQKALTIIGKMFSLTCLVLIFLTPVKINPRIFPIGLIFYIIGLIGLVVSMLNFRDTPLDQPVTSGIYKHSRHPQIVSLFFIFLGICLMIGSWLALIALLLSKLFQHFSILAEEQVCLKQYGEAYRAYMVKIPRYLLFF